MKTGDGIIREYRIVNGRQELVRSISLGGGVPVGGRGMDISRLLSEMPRRDIGLKPRSEWGKKASSPKVRKAGAAEKVAEAKPVAEKPAEEADRNPPKAVEAVGVYAPAEVVIPEMPVELKPEERKALESIGAADGAAECFPPMDERGNGENPIAPEVAAEAVEVEVPRAAEVVVAAIEPQTEQPTMCVLPELPRPAGGGKKKHRRRRRR